MVDSIYKTVDIYPIYCIMPHGRYLSLKNSVFSVIDDSKVNHTTQPVKLFNKDKSAVTVSCEQLALDLEFIYCQRLQFLHEKDLAIYMNWVFDNEDQISLIRTHHKLMLENNLFNKNISVRYVDELIRYGIFSDGFICQDEYIGEYTGIVHDISNSANPFSISYPSLLGNHQIDASQYGNIIRFINHDSVPNCQFKHVLHNNFVHIICIALKPIEINCQLTVDYGKSYWNVMKDKHQIIEIKL